MFFDSLSPGPLVRSLKPYALRLPIKFLTTTKRTQFLLSSLVLPHPTHNNKHDDRRNKVKDRMVRYSRNLKGADADGGDQVPPEGEQILADPATILHSIPPLPTSFLLLSGALER